MSVSIVLVDDHKILRDGLRLRLAHEKDFTVVGEGASAAEAYEVIGRTEPDVVVMDLNLPGDSGIVATAHIRATWPKTRVVVLTGSVAIEAAHDALLAGANGFLRKEDASDELVRAVRAVAAGKTYLSPDAATVVVQALVAKPAGNAEPVLSERETAVLKGLAEGLSYKEIAALLHVSAKTVETYRARLVKKLGSTTRAELVRYAVRKGLVAP